MRTRFIGLTLLVSFSAASASLAVSIAPSAFTGAQAVENFESITAGVNVGASAYANIVLPGTTGDYTFASGITLRGPNPGLFAAGAFVHDAALAGASNNWGTNGSVNNGAQVPDPWGSSSTAYLGAFSNTGSAIIDIAFTSDMSRAGAWVAGAAGSTITVEAYDASNQLLESLTIASPSVAAWGTSFIGLARSEGIRRLVFRGADFGLDGLTFEAASSVAEPSVASLSAAGLLGLWLIGNRGSRLAVLRRITLVPAPTKSAARA